MNEIESHVDRLFEGIPDSARKEEIKLEIILNLSEKVADLVAQGQSREEAVKKAIDDFGDIDDLGDELASSAKLAQGHRLSLSLAFSIWGGILTTALVLITNLYYTPNVIWFVYPTFAVIWWPLVLASQWLCNKRGIPAGLTLSVCGFVLTSGLMLFINLYCTPKSIWFVYPVFALFWWPLAMHFHYRRQKSREGDGGGD